MRSPVVFRVLLAALFVSTSVGLWYATAHRPVFQMGFPGSARPGVYVALLATGVAGIVAVCGLWLWRRWAVVLYACVAAVSIGLDVVAHAPRAHQVTVLVGVAAVLWSVYLHRERFLATPGANAGPALEPTP